ncbi:hypothetical protein [Tessaracoccus sp.]
MSQQPEPADQPFDPEVGVSPDDVAAVARLSAAYEAVQGDWSQYDQTFDSNTGLWKPSLCTITRACTFRYLDEDGDGVFRDSEGDYGSIPVGFITTPRSQWVAAWEATQQARVDAHAAKT